LVEQAAVNRRVVGSSPTGGVPFCTAKLAATPVNAQRREFSISAFSRFLACPKGFSPIAEGCPALSVSREFDRGAKQTLEVGSAPWIPDRKLSESLVNNGCRVNNPGVSGARNQPARRQAGGG